jgi:tetratricopeptide (TPR) repeat protein
VNPILLALAAAAGAAPSGPQGADDQMRACATLARTAPERGIAAADEWRLKGGGLDASHCLGLAYSAAGRWPAAATVFENAAREAEIRQDERSVDFWVKGGNAWIAAGEAAKARRALDAALAAPRLAAELRGEVHLDRARADVALNDLAAARADIDKGLALVAGDPFGWYLSAALARRVNDLPRARTDIAKAVELAPGEAPILLEAGNIAGLSGDIPAARALYARAASASPDSEAGKAAQAALTANAEPAPAPSPAK